MNEEQNLYDKDITFSLERIPGAARCNKVFAESNGRTFGLLTLMNQKCIDIEDEVDTHLKPDQVEGTSINQDLYISQSGIGCDLWVNSCFQVHRQIFQNSIQKLKIHWPSMEVILKLKKWLKKRTPKWMYWPLNPMWPWFYWWNGWMFEIGVNGAVRVLFDDVRLRRAVARDGDSEVELDLFVAEVTSMVAFCQTGELPESVELISQLSIIADRFLMPTLSGLCQQELSRILVRERCPKAAVKAFPFSLTYNSTYLSRKCVQIIKLTAWQFFSKRGTWFTWPKDLEQMSTLYQQRIDLG